MKIALQHGYEIEAVRACMADFPPGSMLTAVYGDRFFPDAAKFIAFETDSGSPFVLEIFKGLGKWYPNKVKHEKRYEPSACPYCGQSAPRGFVCDPLQSDIDAIFASLLLHPDIRLKASLYVKPLGT